MNTDTNVCEQILDTKYKIYSYITEDNEPGTIIVDPKLQNIFDNNKLFNMEKTSVKIVTLREILNKGYISIGSTDHMETLDIVHPSQLISSDKPKIIGKYMYGSRKALIGDQLGIDFLMDPESEPESDSDLDSESILGNKIYTDIYDSTDSDIYDEYNTNDEYNTYTQNDAHNKNDNLDCVHKQTDECDKINKDSAPRNTYHDICHDAIDKCMEKFDQLNDILTKY